ncbi:MAG: NAD(+) synthase [Bacteroidales bacterium]|jgi:NAD+ synthase (glutamine-hydrolysing)|nr:NAD(+) synthase [Bacteroidales bacterium]
MENHGFIKVAAAIPALKVADCVFNTDEILQMTDEAARKKVQIVCFPELSITGYTCADLFQQQLLLQQAETAIVRLLEATRSLDITFMVGAPVRVAGKLFNAAVVCQSGNILGISAKTCLPNYSEFYEQRWFTPASTAFNTTVKYCGQMVPFGNDVLYACNDVTFGVELCEDLWTPAPPSSAMAMAGAQVIFNLSASNELIGKNDYLKTLINQQSARCIAGYVYASAGWGESTTDVVYAGNGIICENGAMLAQSQRFLMEPQLIISEIDVERLMHDRLRINSFMPEKAAAYRTIPFTLPAIPVDKLSRPVHPHPFVPSDEQQYHTRCEEIFSIQTGGLAKRLSYSGIQKVVIGISGGLDSTLALLACIHTFDKIKMDRKNILGITMPGYGTTDRTHSNALSLMLSSGITVREISITAACDRHFQDIGHDPSVHNVTYENVQARERTQILMDIANQEQALVVGTGDLSELALGWTTFNGDHISMYGINSSIPKTLVRYLVRWYAETQADESSRATLVDILETPVSPELLPADGQGIIAQKTEDIVGPYELHDFFLYCHIRFGFAPAKILFLATQAFAGKYAGAEIHRWLHTFYRRFFSQQFKRSCMPDGPKVGSVNLSPRGDWRMPSDAEATLWLTDLPFDCQ